MIDPAQPLESIEIVDADGEPVRVGSAWSERPALLVFIRHFG